MMLNEINTIRQSNISLHTASNEYKVINMESLVPLIIYGTNELPKHMCSIDLKSLQVIP